jgi:inner membrane protein
MPTPLAHGVAGYAFGRTARDDWRAPLRLTAAAFIIAQLPDFDFLPGLLIGDVGKYHRGPTHSLVGAALVAFPLALILWRLAPRFMGQGAARSYWSWYAFALPVYASHLILDLLSPDTVGSVGLRLWWPMSNNYVAAPLPLPETLRGFLDLQFGPGSGAFFGTLFSRHAALVYGVEALIISPVLLLPLLARWLRRRVSAEPVEPAVRVLQSGAEA